MPVLLLLFAALASASAAALRTTPLSLSTLPATEASRVSAAADSRNSSSDKETPRSRQHDRAKSHPELEKMVEKIEMSTY